MSEPNDTWSSTLVSQTETLRQLARFLVQGPDADDVVQDALIIGLRQSEVPRQPLQWLKQVMRHRIIDRARAVKRHKSWENTQITSDETRDAETQIFRREVIEALQKALERLEEPYREVLRQRFLLDQSPSEIAKRSGCPAPTVRWRIHEGLARLRTALDRHFEKRSEWMSGLIGAFGLEKWGLTGEGGGDRLEQAHRSHQPARLGVTKRAGLKHIKDSPMFTLKSTLIVSAAMAAILSAFTFDRLQEPSLVPTKASTSGPEPVAQLHWAGLAPWPLEPQQNTDIYPSADSPSAAALFGARVHDDGIPAIWLSPEWAHCPERFEPSNLQHSVEIQVQWSLDSEGAQHLEVRAQSGCYSPDVCGGKEREPCTNTKQPVPEPEFASCAYAKEWAEGPPEPIGAQGINFTLFADPGEAKQTVSLPSPNAIPLRDEPAEVSAELGLPARRGIHAKAAPRLSILMCADFGPFSRNARDVMSSLLDNYPDLELRWLQSPAMAYGGSYLKDFAVIAAQRQGKFWEMQSLLFDLPAEVSQDEIVAGAHALGLDRTRFLADLADPQTAQHVANQKAWCNAQGLKGTPSFVIGSQTVRALQPLEAFIPVVEHELAH